MILKIYMGFCTVSVSFLLALFLAAAVCAGGRIFMEWWDGRW